MYHARGRQWPVAKQSFPVNVFLRHEAPNSGIARVVAIVTHDKVIVSPHDGLRLASVREIQARVEIVLLDIATVDAHDSFVYLNDVAGQTDDAFDVTL